MEKAKVEGKARAGTDPEPVRSLRSGCRAREIRFYCMARQEMSGVETEEDELFDRQISRVPMARSGQCPVQWKTTRTTRARARADMEQGVEAEVLAAVRDEMAVDGVG